MKKTLVAVAALAAFSGAMAEVVLGGGVDMAVITTKATVAGATTTTKDMYGAAYENSGFTITATEDLGNGLKVRSFIDMGIYGAGNGQGANFTREIYTGLSGEFGSVRLGRILTPAFLAWATNEPTGAMAAPGGHEGTVSMLFVQDERDVRRDETVSYESPSFNGLTFNAQYNSNVAAGTTGAGSGYGVKYATGPFAIQFQTESISGESIASTVLAGASYGGTSTNLVYAGKTTRQVIAASYDFGMAKLHAVSLSAKHNTQENTGYSIGISVPMDAFTFSANMNETTSTTAADSTPGATSAKTTGNVIRANYSLSKRTMLYAAQGRDSYSVVDGNKTVTTSFGLMHSF